MTIIIVAISPQEDVCKNMVDNAVETFGGLHVAFNNHGVAEICGFVDITEEQTSSVINTNLKSLVFCFKYQVRVARHFSHRIYVPPSSQVFSSCTDVTYPRWTCACNDQVHLAAKTSLLLP